MFMNLEEVNQKMTVLLLTSHRVYKLQTDRAPIVGALRCALEYERSLSLRDLRARVSPTQAYNVHAHARTRLLMCITAACTPYNADAFVCLMVRAGRIIPHNSVSVSLVHEST